MTESRVEQLLQQMSLQQPSSQLDERIGDCLRGSQTDLAIRHNRPWAMLSVVAVACLIVGVVIGQSMAPAKAVNQGVAHKSGSRVPEVTAPQEAISVRDSAVRFNAVARIPDVVFEEQLQGPQLAMFCSMASRAGQSTKESGCLQCHQGVTAAESRFRTEHMKNAKFETCLLCHNLPEESEIEHPTDRLLYQ